MFPDSDLHEILDSYMPFIVPGERNSEIKNVQIYTSSNISVISQKCENQEVQK